MAGVGMSRVASPEYYTVCTVLDFPKCAARDAYILDCNQRRPVADCCTVIYDAADFFCNLMADAHCLAAGGCPAVHQCLPGLDQHVGGPVYCLVIGDFLKSTVCLPHPWPRDPSGKTGMVELLCPDCTRITDRNYLFVVIGNGDFQIVTECPAERTGYISYYFCHGTSLL